MGSLRELTAGQVLTARVYKHLAANPEKSWCNTYELMVAGEAGDGVSMCQLAAQDLVQYEVPFHATTVEYDRVVISTWVPDGAPYNPDSFMSVPFGGTLGGLSQGSNEMLPLEACILARRFTDTGRNGRNLYRGVMSELDVTSSAGKWQLAGGTLSFFVTHLDITKTGGLAEQLAAHGFQQVLAGHGTATGGSSVRPVRQVKPMGVSLKKLDNKYFDRKPKA